ncbi:hypothetical protein NC651_034467 [Populus alba x Populus x berolinensis]|nr:hypothetical protein NC651_034467 [Populus alba x Populus x berolinensis]
MFLKKLSYLAKHLRLWNREHFGNQESWLLIVTNRIVENKQAESILTAEESSVPSIKEAAIGYYSGLFTQSSSNRATMGPLGFKHLMEENSIWLARACGDNGRTQSILLGPRWFEESWTR